MPNRPQVRPPPTPIPLLAPAAPVSGVQAPRAPAYRPTQAALELAPFSRGLAAFLAGRFNERAEEAVAAGAATGSGGNLERGGEAWVKAGGDRTQLPNWREGAVKADARKAAHDRYLAVTRSPDWTAAANQVEDATGQLVTPVDPEPLLDRLFSEGLPASVQNEFGRREYLSAAQRYREALLADFTKAQSDARQAWKTRTDYEAIDRTLSGAMDSDEAAANAPAALAKWADESLYSAGVEKPNEFFRDAVQRWVLHQAVDGPDRGAKALRLAATLKFGQRTADGKQKTLGEDAAFAEWSKAKAVDFYAQESRDVTLKNQRIAQDQIAAQNAAEAEFQSALGAADPDKRDGVYKVLQDELNRNAQDPFLRQKLDGLDAAYALVTRPAFESIDTVRARMSRAYNKGASLAEIEEILRQSEVALDVRTKLAGEAKNIFAPLVDASTEGAAQTVKVAAARAAAGLGPVGQAETAARAAELEESVREAVRLEAEGGQKDPAVLKATAAKAAKAAADALDLEAKARRDRKMSAVTQLETQLNQGVDITPVLQANVDVLSEAEFSNFTGRNAAEQSSTRWTGGRELAVALDALESVAGTKDPQTLFNARARLKGEFAAWVGANRKTIPPAEFAGRAEAELTRLVAEIAGTGGTPAEPGAAPSPTEETAGQKVAKGASIPAAEASAAMIPIAYRAWNSPDGPAGTGTGLYTAATSGPVLGAVRSFIKDATAGGSLLEARRHARGALAELGDKATPEDLKSLAEAGGVTIDDLTKGTLEIPQRSMGVAEAFFSSGNYWRNLNTVPPPVVVKTAGLKVNVFATPLFPSMAALDDWFNNKPEALDKFLADQGVLPGDKQAFKLAQMAILKRFRAP